MSRTYKDSPKGKVSRGQSGRIRQHNISVRAVRRANADLRKLSQAAVTMALDEVEAERKAKAQRQNGKDRDD